MYYTLLYSKIGSAFRNTTFGSKTKIGQYNTNRLLSLLSRLPFQTVQIDSGNSQIIKSSKCVILNATISHFLPKINPAGAPNPTSPRIKPTTARETNLENIK